MAFVEPKTFRQLTAPGYFNFSSSQKPTTKKISDWFNSSMAIWTDQANLFDSFFRLWATRDYLSTTIPRTPYIAYLLNNVGLGWYLGTDTQAAALVGYVSRSYPLSDAENFLYLFEVLAAAPFLWCIGIVQIVSGTQLPAIFAETLLIYSDAGAPPSTPAASPYVARDWTPPTGWTIAATSATYYSRGYLSGSDIVWMAPQSTSVVKPFYDVADIASLPVAPTTGSLSGVLDDGTGDQGAIYYYDGAAWRKTTTPNANQGLVDPSGSIPTPQPRAVFAPSSAGQSLISQTPPPSDGPSQGYGMYGGFAQQILRAREIDLSIVLTAQGVENLGVIINLLRRIKPTLNRLLLFYTVDGSSDPEVTVEIFDSGALI